MRCLCQPAINQKGEKNKHLKREIKQFQLFVYNNFLCPKLGIFQYFGYLLNRQLQNEIVKISRVSLVH